MQNCDLGARNNELRIIKYLQNSQPTLNFRDSLRRLRSADGSRDSYFIVLSTYSYSIPIVIFELMPSTRSDGTHIIDTTACMWREMRTWSDDLLCTS